MSRELDHALVVGVIAGVGAWAAAATMVSASQIMAYVLTVLFGVVTALASTLVGYWYWGGELRRASTSFDHVTDEGLQELADHYTRLAVHESGDGPNTRKRRAVLREMARRKEQEILDRDTRRMLR